MSNDNKKFIYLDYAATTPVDPKVLRDMQPYFNTKFGNPSSLYALGRTARQAVEQSRQTVANILKCKPAEIIFTGGGTESINTAILGVARQYSIKHKKPGHVITSSIEHHAVIDTVQALQEEGWNIDYAPVDAEGFVKLQELKKLVRPDTVLVSIIYANNEIGSIQPIAEIGKWLQGLNKARAKLRLPQVYFHTDACQAAGLLTIHVESLHVDLLSFNGSKIYGPKGVGALYIKSGLTLRPVIYGGGQERGLRSGTENVPGIIGLASALQLAFTNQTKVNKHLSDLQHYLDDRLSKKVSNYKLIGPTLRQKSTKDKTKHTNDFKRLPNNLNASFKGIEGESLMLYLDAQGIAVSTGSACSSSSTDPSHVLQAIGIPQKELRSTIRISLGKETTKSQLNIAVEAIASIVNQLKAITNQN